MDSNENSETGKPATDDVAANDQSTVQENTPPPASLENQSPLPQTALPQTQPPMEVHHHGHVHEKKKWKEYLFQFLMLFLAVFCGFLAEYQLEHVIEHQREEKYVHSLIQDLKTDTANLQVYINVRKEKRILMDSLLMLLSTGKHKQFGNATYFFARQVFNGPPFVSTDGTVQQLKNAGNLRLIKNENIINSILAYDASVKELKEWDESDTRIRTTFREMGGSVFNADHLYKAMDSAFKFVRPTTNPQLTTDNQIAINNIAFQIQYLSLSCLGNTQRGKALKIKAENLIEVLNKGYHLH